MGLRKSKMARANEQELPEMTINQVVLDDVEAGTVAWLRDLDEGKMMAAATGKPIFLLFTEMPGCQTCTMFGRNILDNTDIVDAIHEEFVPVLINNRGWTSHDRRVLREYNEAYLNNPVVRFLDANGEDLIPRKDNDYSLESMKFRMTQAVSAAGLSGDDLFNRARRSASSVSTEGSDTESIPSRASTTSGSQSPVRTSIVRKTRATVFFVMSCFWEGEGCIDMVAAKFPGLVQETRAVWVKTDEAVKVVLKTTDRDALKQFLCAVHQTGCASTVLTDDETVLRVLTKSSNRNFFSVRQANRMDISLPAKPSDQKYYLRHTNFKNEKLTEAQKMEINGKMWAKVRRGADVQIAAC
eukprot:Clim_evm76s156 gene=Clim_evmTU76s156